MLTELIHMNLLHSKIKISTFYPQKLHILLFYQFEHDNGLTEILCEVVRKRRDRLSMEYKIGPLAKVSL